MTPPRVLLVAEQLRRPAAGGIGTYARGLLHGLDQLPAADRPDVTLLASRHRGAGPDPLAGLGRGVVTSPLPGQLLTRAWDRGILSAPRGADLVHTVSLATTETRGVPLVATVHDLLWRVVPEAYPAHGRRWHEAALARALRRAAHFVVPAAEVEAALVDAGAPPAAVSVVPLGSDHLPPPDHAAAAALLARLGVTGPYLLSVGTLEPRKNLRRLTEAYAGIRHRLPEPWPLVVVGPAGWGDRLAPTPGVVLTGEVPAPVLTSLYRRALLVAYVPLVEGFGLPPVEAMAAGTPTVTSPLPGVGGASHLVDPRDVEAIADGLLVVATDERVRRDLVGRGTERAAHLTWLSLARRHLEVWTALT